MSASSTNTTPLFVRLPAHAAAKLDRAAFELNTPKKDLVAGLVERYVDPDAPEDLAQLVGDRRRVTVELDPDRLTVGRHSFRPAPKPDVLTLEQLAELLQADAADLEAMAEAGELPGRRIGKMWRFSRAAVLEWLGGAGA